MKTVFLLHLIFITLAGPAYGVLKYRVPDVCDEYTPLLVTSESVVVHVPTRIPHHNKTRCRVHLPASTNQHRLGVNVRPAGKGGVSYCGRGEWVTITDRKGRVFASDTSAVCQQTALIRQNAYLDLDYGPETSAVRRASSGPLQVILTPYHYLVCTPKMDSDADSCMEDTIYWCSMHTDGNECGGRMYMKSKYCRYTCGICTPGPCADHYQTCTDIATRGLCEPGGFYHIASHFSIRESYEHKYATPQWVREHCAASCGLCPGNQVSCCYWGDYLGTEHLYQFHVCDTHRCIRIEMVCDGVPNCWDGSDEGEFCETFVVPDLPSGGGVAWGGRVWCVVVAVVVGWMV